MHGWTGTQVMSTITLKKCDRCSATFDLAEFEQKAQSTPLSARHPLYKVKYTIGLGVGLGEIDIKKEVCLPCRLHIADAFNRAMES